MHNEWIAPLPDWNTKGDADGGVLQTKYRTIAVDVQNILARKHSRNKQFFHLLGKVLLRLLSSMILAAAMIGTFKYYETIKVLSDFQKNVFNLLSTGIYLTMGLNLAVSSSISRK